MQKIKLGILTISDRASNGVYEDILRQGHKRYPKFMDKK